MAAAEFDKSYYVLPNDIPICSLTPKLQFESLTDKERLYAYHLCRASWDGAAIIHLQISPESPFIFVLLRKLFGCKNVAQLEKTAVESCNFTKDEFKAFLVYSAGIFYNGGNYKGFGDTKFVPGVDLAKVELLMTKSLPPNDAKLWEEVKTKLYSLKEGERSLGFTPQGVTTYHSRNVTAEDAKIVDQNFMLQHKLEGWNSRLFKTQQNDRTVFDMRLASVENGEVLSESSFESVAVKVTKGDYDLLLKRVVASLQQAKAHAANERQEKMLTKYIESFTTGSIDAHKDGSRHWVKDMAPTIESYIGFIENYRDPAGVRSEFEGIVSIVNKEMSAQFTRLVENEHLIQRLPWGKDYEKEKFLKPDFTSLDVICFGCSDVCEAINIPNYDDIRQSVGFKNVTLGNIIMATPDVRVTFISDQDDALFKRFVKNAIIVHVGLHELLGHGTGKLFYKMNDGSYNFDTNIIDLETGKKVSCWYKEGETWSSKFGDLASPYEECRADAVAWFLCCYEDVLKVFGFEGQEAQDIKYVNWLNKMRDGLVGTEFYFPDRGTWGQAHCYARHVLLRVCMAAGGGFVTLEERTAADGKPDLFFSIDRTKIDTIGKGAIFEFLKLLQLYKSTGNVQKGKELFEKYSHFDQQWMRYREIVILRRKPMPLYVQPNTTLENGRVTMKEYPATLEGLIESVVDRYKDDIDVDLIALSARDKQHFQ